MRVELAPQRFPQRRPEMRIGNSAMRGDFAIGIGPAFHGLIAARCGGCSSATRHCSCARYETPESPTLPVLQDCVPAHSIVS